MEKLTIGRIVHFVFEKNGELIHRPAIVVAVWSQDCCSLQVFIDGTNDDVSGDSILWKTSVIYSEEPKDYSWHWCERE